MSNFVQVKGHTFVNGEPHDVMGFVLHVYLKAWGTPAALNMVDMLTEDGDVLYRVFVLEADLLGVDVKDIFSGSERFAFQVAEHLGGARATFILASLIYREKEELRQVELEARDRRTESRRNAARLLATRTA